MLPGVELDRSLRLPVRRTHEPDQLTRTIGSLEKLGELTRSSLAAEAARVHPNPTEAQKESGNYKKGHVSWKGLDLTIETAKGQHRRGVDKDGKAWSTEMHAHHGYIKNTESEADGDHIDIFLSDHYLDSEIVFVINQVDPKTKRFDEHKCVLGCVSAAAAKALYLSCYSEGWQGFDSIKPMTLDDFKVWVYEGDTSKRAAEQMWCRRCKEKWEECQCPGKTAADAEASPYTIAVDLDGTLAEQEKPFNPKTVGKLREGMKKKMDAFHEAGVRLIIFSVRGDTEQIKKWAKENAIPYDYVNYNPDQPAGASGKVFAHAYWDDRGWNAQDLEEHFPRLLQAAKDHARKRNDDDRKHEGDGDQGGADR